MPLCFVSSLELIQQALELLHLFLVLQEDGHNNRLKWPRPRHHDTGLNVKFGAIEEPIKDDLILFWKRPLERRPSAALIFNELTERW